LQRGDVEQLVAGDVRHQKGIAGGIRLEGVHAARRSNASRQEISRDATIGPQVEDHIALARPVPVEVLLDGVLFFRDAIDLKLKARDAVPLEPRGRVVNNLSAIDD
jgi:hypothetical protein